MNFSTEPGLIALTSLHNVAPLFRADLKKEIKESTKEKNNKQNKNLEKQEEKKR